VAVVEGGHQLDLVAAQLAAAEHVPRHVADPDDGDRLGLDVHAQLAKVALHRQPGAPGGDAHRLVVVAAATAGGEGVSQPEAVLGADGVSQVRERGRALVRGHHQVGVVTVDAAHLRGTGDLAVHDVVGDVQQAADEHLVLAGDLTRQRFRVARGAFEDEAALRPVGDDDGVLDHLRLHQAEHLGPVVLQPVRPANTPTGDGAAAQVDPLHPRAGDEHLTEGHRPWHVGYRRAVELQRQVLPPLSGGVGDPPIGPHGGLDQTEVAAQDPVRIEPLHRPDPGQHPAAGLLHLLVGSDGRVEAGVEQGDQRPGHGRLLDQRGVQVRLREGGADLAAVTAVGPQQRDLLPGQPRPQHQRVQRVDLRPVVPQRRRRLGQPGGIATEVHRFVGLQAELLDVEGIRRGRRLDTVEHLVDHGEAEALQDRQERRQGDGRTAPVEHEPQRPTLSAVLRAQHHRHIPARRAGQTVEFRQIQRRRCRRGALAVVDREAGQEDGNHPPCHPDPVLLEEDPLDRPRPGIGRGDATARDRSAHSCAGQRRHGCSFTGTLPGYCTARGRSPDRRRAGR
jgi:hypothetical protein